MRLLSMQRKGLACAIAYLAIAGDALIGVYADERHIHGQTDEICQSHVGDAQVRWARSGSYVVYHLRLVGHISPVDACVCMCRVPGSWHDHSKVAEIRAG